jgi:predicted RNase H-like nuclease (RuvC/YqgF family)
MWKGYTVVSLNLNNSQNNNSTGNNNKQQQQTNNKLDTSVHEYHENLYSLKSALENLTRFCHQMHWTTSRDQKDEQERNWKG